MPNRGGNGDATDEEDEDELKHRHLASGAAREHTDEDDEKK